MRTSVHSSDFVYRSLVCLLISLIDNHLWNRLDCSNGYRCEGTQLCLPLSKVCDGRNNCPLFDDELVCDFTCPKKCYCSGFLVNCNNANITNEVISRISTHTRLLDLSQNELISKPVFGIRQAYDYLYHLNISFCNIIRFSKNPFANSSNLLLLDISFNNIQVLESHTFRNLFKLKVIILYGNRNLLRIDSYSFMDLKSVSKIMLSGIRLDVLRKDTFSGLTLEQLILTESSFGRVENRAFNNLKAKEIDILTSDIKYFDSELFNGVEKLNLLKTSSFKFCCYRPVTLAEENCYPHKDEFSSCEDLIRNTTLRALLWVMGFLAVIGNACSIAYRLTIDRRRLVLGYGIFVTNLAISDFLMGIYLLIVAVADAVFRDRY